jgi:hypothetical protein
MCFRRQFICKMWPIQLTFLLFIVYRIFLSPLNVCNTYSFQNIPVISDILSEVSRFQHHTMLCSKCSTSLVSSLNLNAVCWCKGKKSLLPVECSFCHGNPGFYLMCTSCIVCYHAAERVEIFHIRQVFLICYSL